MAAIGKLNGAARAAAERKMEETGRAQDQWVRRLNEIDREVAILQAREVDREWVTGVLSDFDGLWDAMTPANRRRLVDALVERIVVDEPGGEVAVHLYDVAGTSASRIDAAVPS